MQARTVDESERPRAHALVQNDQNRSGADGGSRGRGAPGFRSVVDPHHQQPAHGRIELAPGTIIQLRNQHDLDPTAFIASFILLFPKEILSIAGKDYAVVVVAFALLLLGNLANGFLSLNGSVLLGVGKSRLTLGISVAALTLTLLLNWLFIPRFGITGAALASALVLVLQNLVQYAVVRWHLRLSLCESHLYINGMIEIALVVALFASYSTLETYTLGGR